MADTKKSIKDLAAEVGQVRQAKQAAANSVAEKERQRQAQEAQLAKERLAAMERLFENAKSALGEAHEGLKPFVTNQFLLRLDDARKDIARRAENPTSMSNRIFDTHALPDRRVVETFVGLVFSGEWTIGFAREITNHLAIVNTSRGRHSMPVAIEHGDLIIAYVYQIQSNTFTLLEETDPLHAEKASDWASVHVARMMAQLK